MFNICSETRIMLLIAILICLSSISNRKIFFDRYIVGVLCLIREKADSIRIVKHLTQNGQYNQRYKRQEQSEVSRSDNSYNDRSWFTCGVFQVMERYVWTDGLKIINVLLLTIFVESVKKTWTFFSTLSFR